MKTTPKKYLVIWPDNKAEVIERSDIEYPALKCQGCIAIVGFEVYDGERFNGETLEGAEKGMKNVTLDTYYRAGAVDLI